MNHLDKGPRFSEDLMGRLLRDQPHCLLHGHNDLIVLLLTFNSIGDLEAGRIPRIYIKEKHNEKQ